MDKSDWFPIMLLGVFIPISLGFLIPSAIEIDIRSQEISAEIQQLDDDLHIRSHELMIICAMAETLKIIVSDPIPEDFNSVEHVLEQCLE